jgi:hypothetical protein
MDDLEWGEWFDSIIMERELARYPAFFGETQSEFYTFPDHLVSKESLEMLEETGMSLNLVIEYAPNEKRNSWLYVTSGLTNPSGEDPQSIDPTDYSGIGFEMIIETNEKCLWPVNVLHMMMFSQCLISSGMVEGDLLEYKDIFPLSDGAIKGSQICSFVAIDPDQRCSYPTGFELSTGKVDFFPLFGITLSEEKLFLGNKLGVSFMEFLEKAGYPVVDPLRIGLTLDDFKKSKN